MSLRPAAAAGVALQQVLGGELAAGAVGDDVALEIGFAAKQPEAVPDLPFDGDAGVGGWQLPGALPGLGAAARRHGRRSCTEQKDGQRAAAAA